MLLENIRRSTCREATRARIFSAMAGFLLPALWLVSTAQAQQRNENITNMSDLASQNMSRVAASPAEIKSLLLNISGLMVELKRWVAKDATDHGQIVSDSDLTNEAILERLESDVQFRSVATALVQRYGYLLPKLNPDSEAAKERELLIQERTKWLAQNQEEELAQARQRGTRSLQNAESCDPRLDRDCNVSQTRSSTSGGLRQGLQQEESPSRTAPSEPNSPNLPPPDGNSLLRTQLSQTGEDFGGTSSQYPTSDSNDSVRSFN